MVKKRVFTMLLAASMAASSLAIVASADSDRPIDPAAEIDESKIRTDVSGKLTIWTWGTYDTGGAVDFYQYFPNVDIDVVMVPNFEEKLQATVASGGELPDIVFMEIGRRAQEMQMDLWENLEEPPYNFNRDDLVDWAIPLMENERGEIVCVQWDMAQCGLLYRRDLAEEYFGVSEPEDMEKMFPDWESVMAAGPKLAEDSDGKVKLFAGSDDIFQAMAAQITEPLVKDGKPNFEESYKEIFANIERMTQDNVVGMDTEFSPSWNTSFTNGSTIFWPCPTWLIPWNLKPNDKEGNNMYGLMNMPGGATSWGGTAGAIPKDKPEEQKKLAWEWIHWLTCTEEGAKSFSRVNGVPTLYKPALSSGIYSSPDNEYFNGQDTIQKFLSMDDVIIPPMTVYDERVENSALSGLRVIDQGGSADDAYQVLIDEFKIKAPELYK